MDTTSIILLSGKDALALELTLAAIARQARQPGQVLVISETESQSLQLVLNRYRAQLPVTVLVGDAASTAQQRNLGVRHSSGEIVAFLEAGLAPLDDWLVRMEEGFAQHRDMTALQGNIVAPQTRVGAACHLELHEFQSRATQCDGPHATFVDTRNFAVRGGTIRRFREPFSERIEGCEQEDLYWKLLAEGIRPWFLATVSAELRVATDSALEQFRKHYRTGIGLLQLRRLHDGFRDPRLTPAQSKTHALTWLGGELLGSGLRDTLRQLRQRGAAYALVAYPSLLARRLGLMVGLTRGRKRHPLAQLPGKTPQDLLFFVTNKCNLRCQHCFYIEDLKKPTQTLSAGDVARVVASLDRDLRSVSFTGGEPMLCPDLVEICEVFASNIRVFEVSIATNGYYTQRTVKAVEAILGFANYKLYVRVSLDGLKQTHDRLRKNPRSFDHAVNTIRLLKNLSRDHPRLHVQIQTSVGESNSHELDELAEFVANEFGVFQTFEIARDVSMFAGGPFFLSGYGPPDKSDLLTIEAIETTRKRIHSIYARYLSMGHFDRYQVEFQEKLIEIAADHVRGGKPVLHCTTGDSMVCILPNKDVAICEMTQPIGNLADFDFDLRRLLQERFSTELRSFRDACYCTNACNNSSSLKTLNSAC